MKQYDLNKIQANSSNELISKISKERIKKNCKSPDVTKLHCIEVPSLRLKYYVKNKKRALNRIKMIENDYPGREIKSEF